MTAALNQFISRSADRCRPRWLHREDSKMGHNLGRFWHQIHALYLNQRPNPGRFGRQVHWEPCRKWIKGTMHGWKISWLGYGARTIVVEGIRGWGSELKRVWRGPSLDLTRKTHSGKVVKARLFGHEQRGRVRSIIERNVYDSEDRGKIGYNVLGFKAGHRSGERRIRGKWWETASVFDSNQALQRKFESFNLQHIPRGGNTHVDSLATLATSSAQNLPWVILIEDLGKPLGEKGNMIYVPYVRIGPNWMDPIIQFLSKDVLPEDK